MFDETLKARLALEKQFCWARRVTTRICDDCLQGHFHPCEKDNCPCLCNDPLTSMERKRLRGE